MKALSILQPWAYAILHLRKDVENRTWRTNFRGRFLIHTGKGFDVDGYDWLNSLRIIALGIELPKRDEFPRGGIVGSSVIRDCVQTSESPWFFGPYGFVLQGAKPMSFIPYRGERGWFDVPDALVVGDQLFADAIELGSKSPTS